MPVVHAFIDKIFELYRHKLMSRGIDPEETYPVKNIALHGPEHKTIFITKRKWPCKLY
jgi:hypothetical protein